MLCTLSLEECNCGELFKLIILAPKTADTSTINQVSAVITTLLYFILQNCLAVFTANLYQIIFTLSIALTEILLTEILMLLNELIYCRNKTYSY